MFICVQEQKRTKTQIINKYEEEVTFYFSSLSSAVPINEDLCVAKCRMDAMLSSMTVMIVYEQIERDLKEKGNLTCRK